MIVLAGEECLGFQFGDKAIRRVQFPIEVFEQIVLLFGVGLFLRQVDVSLNVAGDRGKSCIRGNLLFGALSVAKNGLRRFLIVPEIRLGDARFEGFQSFAVLRRVKDNSEPA